MYILLLRNDVILSEQQKYPNVQLELLHNSYKKLHNIHCFVPRNDVFAFTIGRKETPALRGTKRHCEERSVIASLYACTDRFG